MPGMTKKIILAGIDTAYAAADAGVVPAIAGIKKAAMRLSDAASFRTRLRLALVSRELARSVRSGSGNTDCLLDEITVLLCPRREGTLTNTWRTLAKERCEGRTGDDGLVRILREQLENTDPEHCFEKNEKKFVSGEIIRVKPGIYKCKGRKELFSMFGKKKKEAAAAAERAELTKKYNLIVKQRMLLAEEIRDKDAQIADLLSKAGGSDELAERLSHDRYKQLTLERRTLNTRFTELGSMAEAIGYKKQLMDDINFVSGTDTVVDPDALETEKDWLNIRREMMASRNEQLRNLMKEDTPDDLPEEEEDEFTRAAAAARRQHGNRMPAAEGVE